MYSNRWSCWPFHVVFSETIPPNRTEAHVYDCQENGSLKPSFVSSYWPSFSRSASYSIELQDSLQLPSRPRFEARHFIITKPGTVPSCGQIFFLSPDWPITYRTWSYSMHGCHKNRKCMLLNKLKLDCYTYCLVYGCFKFRWEMYCQTDQHALLHCQHILLWGNTLVRQLVLIGEKGSHTLHIVIMAPELAHWRLPWRSNSCSQLIGYSIQPSFSCRS